MGVPPTKWMRAGHWGASPMGSSEVQTSGRQPVVLGSLVLCEVRKVGDAGLGCLISSQVPLSLSWEKWLWAGPVGLVS